MSNQEIETLFTQKKHALEQAPGLCPDCNGTLVSRYHRQNHFLGCSNYPSCNYKLSLHPTGHIVKMLDVSCPQCTSELALRNGRYGMFIGCSAFPECHYIRSIDEDRTEEPSLPSIACPECAAMHRSGKLVARQTRYGKRFYSCSEYPLCKYSLKGTPIDEPCSHCGFPITMVLKEGGNPLCASKKCSSQEKG